MNVTGITGDKDSPLAEVIGNAMMHVVRGKPVDLAHIHVDLLFDVRAYFLKGEAFMAGNFLGNYADQPEHSAAANRECQDKGVRTDACIYHFIKHQPFGLDIGDIKQLFIGAAGKVQAELLPDSTARSIAAADISKLTSLFCCAVSQGHLDGRSPVTGLDELSVPFNMNARFFQALYQQMFMIILREAKDERD